MGMVAATLQRLAAGGRVGELRAARYRRFVHGCAVIPEDTILNVGAGRGGALERFTRVNPIVALDLDLSTPSGWLTQENVAIVAGDGRALPFESGSFDICFCSSVVQYVPAEERAAFAAEIRRVADRYFVQTPNRWFPIEPHYLVPFFQFLPRRVQRWVNAHVGLGWRGRGSWTETRMLTARELQRLFPDARIERERLYGLTKSLMAVRGPR
jgi:2-polyprenyl-3-methyl-5-hydroxy-6-metoxy-1,4-benzoquinol methylase